MTVGSTATKGRHEVGKKSLSVICAVVLALTMVAAPLAQAEEVTRQGYKEAVEPICKANTQANERILKGVRREVKEGKLKAAGRQFGKAGAALKRTHAELRAVPQPPADATKLAKWLSLIGTEVTLFQKAATQLKAENKTAAQATVIRLEHNATQANNQVLGFEFHYCRFEPSKFT
jgi:UDP-glucose 6-dehydrogenase